MQEERHAAERRPGRDVHDLAAAVLPHHRNDGAARQEHRGDVHLHHAVPLLERDLRERAHLERGVEAGVVHEDVDATVTLERLSDHPLDVLLDETSADPAVGRLEVCDHDLRALGLRPTAIAARRTARPRSRSARC